MPRTARIIATLCFVGFACLLLSNHPQEPIPETTPEPEEMETGLWLAGAFFLWLITSGAAVLHGLCELFICDEFRLRRGPVVTICLALPGIVYFFYGLIAQTT